MWRYVADFQTKPGYPGFPFGDIEDAEFDRLCAEWEPLFVGTHGKAADSGNWKHDDPAGAGEAEPVTLPTLDPAGTETGTETETEAVDNG